MGVATNNAAELEAIRRVLMAAPLEGKLLVLTDSQYALKCMTGRAAAWARNGWRVASGQPVKNQQVLSELLQLVQQRPGRVKFEWVQGHAGHPLNEAADRLAVQLRTRAPRAAMLAGPGWPVGGS